MCICALLVLLINTYIYINNTIVFTLIQLQCVFISRYLQEITMNILNNGVTNIQISEKLIHTSTHKDLAITLMDTTGYFFHLYIYLSLILSFLRTSSIFSIICSSYHLIANEIKDWNSHNSAQSSSSTMSYK